MIDLSPLPWSLWLHFSVTLVLMIDLFPLHWSLWLHFSVTLSLGLHPLVHSRCPHYCLLSISCCLFHCYPSLPLIHIIVFAIALLLLSMSISFRGASHGICGCILSIIHWYKKLLNYFHTNIWTVKTLQQQIFILYRNISETTISEIIASQIFRYMDVDQCKYV